VVAGDAVELGTALGDCKPFPLILSSPPYCRSVEYSRRHRLELFWLGLVDDRNEFLDLKHRYLGRDYVRVSDWSDGVGFGIRDLDYMMSSIRKNDPHRSRTVHHYFSHMQRVLEGMRGVMTSDGTLILVVGNSTCRGIHIDTAGHLVALAQPWFSLDYRFSYALRNHYMQYALWNGTGIREEHVLVFRPRPR